MSYMLCNFAAPFFFFNLFACEALLFHVFFLISPDSLSVTLLRSVPRASTMVYHCVIYCTTYIAHHSPKNTNFR